MLRKAVFLIVMLLLSGTITYALSIRRVEAAGEIFIMADGSVQGTTFIQTVDNSTYVFTANVSGAIEVRRSNIVLDGKGYLVEGWFGTGAGIYVGGVTNVTIQNLNVDDHIYSIFLSYASNCTISRCNVTSAGVYVERSSNNIFSGNDMASGIALSQSDSNRIYDNIFSSSGIGIYASNNNSLFGNSIVGAGTAIILSSWYIDGLYFSSNNIVFGNNIENNSVGLAVTSSNNTIYHNNFINNTQQASVTPGYSNFWDNGYPSGGNYWSNYNGTDLHSGLYQNETGSDGVGDVPYVIDGNNTDKYPLFHPYVPLSGDLNLDGTVDMYDAVLAAKAFGSTPSSPNWNSAVDLNGDGQVDIFDMIMLAHNFGKVYHP